MSMKLMVRILEEVDLPRPQQAVLLSMAENANDDGSKCYPSVDLIAWKAGYKPRAVVDIIRDMRKSGVLQVVAEATGTRPTEYTIHLDKAPQKQSFDEWQAANGRHVERPKRPTLTRENAPRDHSQSVENAPLGCNPASLGVQNDVPITRENAPEPVMTQPRPSQGTSQLPRNGEAQTLVAVLYEDILGIGRPTNYSTVVGQAAQLVKVGCTPVELQEIAAWLLRDSWHADKGITMGTIVRQRDNYRSAKSPNAKVTHLSAPASRSTNASGDKNMTNDELEEFIATGVLPERHRRTA